jgi:DNA-binding transcriptional LysR family regulator
MRNLPTDSLRSFLAIYDSGSVTTAADQIGRSQPAVSLQIKKLEEILETSLFRRVKKRLIPSLEGEKLCARARKEMYVSEYQVSLR